MENEQPKLVKVKTEKVRRYNQTINNRLGSVRFDASGVAEVSQEMAEYLEENDPSIKIATRGFKLTNKIKSIEQAEETIAAQAEVISGFEAKQKELLQEIAALNANLESKGKIIADYKQKEQDQKITNAKKALLDKTPAQLRIMCEKADLPEKEYKGFGKPQLVDYLYEKLK